MAIDVSVLSRPAQPRPLHHSTAWRCTAAVGGPLPQLVGASLTHSIRQSARCSTGPWRSGTVRLTSSWPARRGPMRFHVHLLPTYFPDRDAPFDVYYQQILEQIELAEELGFECFWFTEHHFLLYGGPRAHPAVIMCAAAARTPRIHLGRAGSILPLHPPPQLAPGSAVGGPPPGR